MASQKEFWEDDKVLGRRTPSHPVIEMFAQPKIDLIRNILGKYESNNHQGKMSLLDIGCGNGYFSYYLARYFDVTCIDFSRNILSVCPVIKKIQASALALPAADRSYNITFCANLLHHIKDPLHVIDEMIRVSSRYVVVIEPNAMNPLMVLIALISKEDRAVINYTSKFINSLLTGRCEILFQGTSGFILPNITPLSLLSIIKAAEPYLWPKLYHIVVAKKYDG